jgi:hypothetical protein
MLLLPAFSAETLLQVLCHICVGLEHTMKLTFGVHSVAPKDTFEHPTNAIPRALTMPRATKAPCDWLTKRLTQATQKVQGFVGLEMLPCVIRVDVYAVDWFPEIVSPPLLLQ